MKILITNHEMSRRTGSELYVYETALTLRQMGHEVEVYASRCGALADRLRNEGVPVTDDFFALPFRPEILHLQPRLEALLALAHFRGVPAFYHCHGFLPVSQPPRHPRVFAIGMVARQLSLWINRDMGMPEDLCRLQMNGVDRARFRPGPPLPERPCRALVYGSYAGSPETWRVMKEVCKERGVTLDFAGWSHGHVVENPGELMQRYDLVFTSGRSAMEAGMTGRAIVIHRDDRLFFLVKPENYDVAVVRNFATSQPKPGAEFPVTPERLRQELDAYDAAGCAEVGRRIAVDFDLGEVTRRLVGLYEEVIGLARERGLPDLVEEIEVEVRELPEAIRIAEGFRTGALEGALEGFTERCAALMGEIECQRNLVEALRDGWEKTKRLNEDRGAALRQERAKLKAVEESLRKTWLGRRQWARLKRGWGRIAVPGRPAS